MIQRFMIISAIVLSTITGQALTQLPSLAQSPSPSSSRLSPYDVIFLAYQGQFREQGIRGYGAFIEQCYQGQLSAKKIVEAAIKANRLPADALNDSAYLKAIDSNLVSLKSNVNP
ncbi:MAG: hypothetical protein MUC48_06580 [Leptolyngbya sp. Prado105]|nr:hypothetical protein [Leptolyngbya sp. Prado105]